MGRARWSLTGVLCEPHAASIPSIAAEPPVHDRHLGVTQSSLLHIGEMLVCPFGPDSRNRIRHRSTTDSSLDRGDKTSCVCNSPVTRLLQPAAATTVGLTSPAVTRVRSGNGSKPPRKRQARLTDFFGSVGAVFDSSREKLCPVAVGAHLGCCAFDVVRRSPEVELSVVE